MPIEITYPQTESGIDIEEQACLIPISVGQKYHAPEALRETLLQLSAKHYKKYVFIKADLLQHYTFMMRDPTLSKADASALALEKGKEWHDQSLPIIHEILGSNCSQVVSWQDCLDDSLSAPAITQIKERYTSDLNFQKAINDLVEKYLEGFESQGKKEKKPKTNTSTSVVAAEKTAEQLRKENLCRQYVLEETALIMAWQDRRCRLSWPDEKAKLFFLAYAFGGHSSNKAIYDHLTHLCLGKSYQLINIKVSVEPKKQRKEKDEVEAKLELISGAMLALMKASDLSADLQLAAIAMMTKKLQKKDHKEQVNIKPVAQPKDNTSSSTQINKQASKERAIAPPATFIPITLSHSQQVEKDDAHSTSSVSLASSLSSNSSERNQMLDGHIPNASSPVYKNSSSAPFFSSTSTWRNSPSTIETKFNQNRITHETKEHWLSSCLNNDEQQENNFSHDTTQEQSRSTSPFNCFR